MSAIIHGGPNKQKEEFILPTINISKIVVEALPDIQNDNIADIWCVAAQVPIVSINNQDVLFGIEMYKAAIKAHPRLTQSPMIQAVMSNVLSTVMEYIPEEREAQ